MGNVINFLRCLCILGCGCCYRTQLVRTPKSTRLEGKWMNWRTWNAVEVTTDETELDVNLDQEEEDDDDKDDILP